MPNEAEILETEFSRPFIEGMKDRMLISFYKYGPIERGFPDKVDAVGSLRDRLRMYASTGNTEYLMDVANFAMIEFMRPRHPAAHFKPTDDDGSPGRRSVVTGTQSKQSNADMPE